jgi:hypothetical protein
MRDEQQHRRCHPMSRGGSGFLPARKTTAGFLLPLKPSEIKKLTFISSGNMIAFVLQNPQEQLADGSQSLCISID